VLIFTHAGIISLIVGSIREKLQNYHAAFGRNKTAVEQQLVSDLENFLSGKPDSLEIQFNDFETYLNYHGKSKLLDPKYLRKGRAITQVINLWRFTNDPCGDISKTVLQNKILEYDRTKGFFRRKKDREEVKLLKNFIGELSENYPNKDMISYREFQEYLDKNNNAGLISPNYLYSGSLSAIIFQLWRQQPQRAAVEQNPKLIQCASRDIHQHLLSFFHTQSLGRLAQVSRGMNQLTQNWQIWRPRLLQVGFPQELVLLAQEHQQSLKNLYRSYTKLPHFLKRRIKELWQLQCLSGDWRILKELANNKSHQDSRGAGILLYLSLGFDVYLIQRAITKGLDINATKNNGASALHFACLGGDIEMLKFLLNAGLDINATDNNGASALHFACWGGDIEMLKFLQNAGLDINAADDYGASALHYACWGGDIEMLTFLLNAGLDINATNNDDRSALHYACEGGGDIEMLTFLLDAGLDINAADEYGRSALYYAPKNKKQEISELFTMHQQQERNMHQAYP